MSVPVKILVVDDVPLNVKLLHDMLVAAGYDVTTASTGQEALDSVENEPPNLILLDIMMPDMNGYEVCRQLKSQAKSKDIPVLFVTALDEADDEVLGFEVGAADFITKPVNAVLVEARVKTHLDLYAQKRHIEEKNTELLALSNKLSKYLSPQVYSSIFSGKQEVSLNSQRKKLTILFSDIVNFTETTDRIEAEDLTFILNQYLTEMTDISLQYGGTVDKYIGDAIMLFFGDPETHGVKEDALACVKTAIAMQQRIAQLNEQWLDTCLHSPLVCRIGIHTGYCAVGNFGSKDRMDYTIIGGAVNLASRLEHEAPAGGILLSSDTHTLVKDNIECQEMGDIKMRGIAYPVDTFKVMGLKSDLEN